MSLTVINFILGIVGLAAVVSLVVGSIWGLVISFNESTGQGLLFLFIPLYAIYYFISRWDKARTPGILFLAGLGAVILVPVIFALINSAVGGLSSSYLPSSSDLQY